ncbi:type 2 lanthipeptide synthetase LanM family protein [Longispora albida]|uniref:type 2 lanthipeptide synthetase LanM family protein n=1 Tax=Longispora albida TaxID=203523 RepID=UPI000378A0DE|nr:type 2 lanthipeptide synthetase LanM family protein [Longispora albida]
MTDVWWARGLTLAERIGGRPSPAGVPGERPKARLARWLEGYPSEELLATRLGELGVDLPGMLALLAEDAEDLGSRSAVPGWARAVDHVLASTPAELPAEGELTWADGFKAIFAPFARQAAGLLPQLPDVDNAAIRAAFTERLSRELVRLGARCLVLEVNVARVSGRLTGETPGQRFTDFVRQTAARDGLRAFLMEYVVLARLLAQACGHAAEAMTELLARFAADRALLVRTLLGGTDPGELTTVEAGAGDGHRRGRSVAVLTFADGRKVVYKPRPQAVHAHFNEVLRWFNSRIDGLSLRAVDVVERHGYGWVSFAEAKPCGSEDEVREFYRRQGLLLSLLYALDCTDIHYENLIAAGPDPVLIDVETLFHPALPQPSETGPDPAAQALQSSVYQVSLLPRMFVSSSGSLDVSGLGGDAGAQSPFESVDWDAPGTDEMRLTRRSRTFPGSANRPVLGGEAAVPERYAAEILDGFRLGYDTISVYREDLASKHGLLRRFAGTEVRVVPRATRWYARLLDESTHPDVMRDALDRDRILDMLWPSSADDQVRRALVSHELREMWAGDIPFFTSRPAATELWDSADRQVAALPETGLDRVLRKLRGMDRVDRYDQEWIIKAALVTRGRSPEHCVAGPRPAGQGAGLPPVAADSDRLLAAARSIADQLVATAYQGDGRVNWLGLEPLSEQHWNIMPLGASLGSGYCGPALYLAQLAALTGTERYAALARRAIGPLPRLLDSLSRYPEQIAVVGPGGFAGFGGIAYTLAQLSGLLGDPELPAATEQAAALTSAAAESCTDTGVLAGLAGGLAAMLGVHEAGQDAPWRAAAWKAAEVCAARLAGLPPAEATGFADGRAGTGWALVRFAEAGGGDRYRRMGLDLLGSLPEVTAAPERADLTWCQGLTGVGLAVAGVPELADVSDRAVSAITNADPLPSHCLCHGELGALELLKVRGQRLGSALATVERNGPACGTPGGVASPGLLAGLAGIGHGVLRMGFADRVPSALLLHSLQQ